MIVNHIKENNRATRATEGRNDFFLLSSSCLRSMDTQPPQSRGISKLCLVPQAPKFKILLNMENLRNSPTLNRERVLPRSISPRRPPFRVEFSGEEQLRTAWPGPEPADPFSFACECPRMGGHLIEDPRTGLWNTSRDTRGTLVYPLQNNKQIIEIISQHN